MVFVKSFDGQDHFDKDHSGASRIPAVLSPFVAAAVSVSEFHTCTLFKMSIDKVLWHTLERVTTVL